MKNQLAKYGKKKGAKEIEYITDNGFNAKVVESVNVHESIKLGDESRDYYIENYKKLLKTYQSSVLRLFVIISCLF